MKAFDASQARECSNPIVDGTVTALIVPQGKILDFIDGKLRKETPEEYVRQEIEKSLVREYDYEKTEVAVEFRVRMGRKPKRANLAIFPEESLHKQEHVWAIVPGERRDDEC